MGFAKLPYGLKINIWKIANLIRRKFCPPPAAIVEWDFHASDHYPVL